MQLAEIIQVKFYGHIRNYKSEKVIVIAGINQTKMFQLKPELSLAKCFGDVQNYWSGNFLLTLLELSKWKWSSQSWNYQRGNAIASVDNFISDKVNGWKSWNYPNENENVTVLAGM